MEEKEATVKEQEKLISDVNADISKQEEKGMKIKEEKSLLEGKSQNLRQEVYSVETKCSELKRAAEVMNNKCRDKLEEIDAKTEEIEKIKTELKKEEVELTAHMKTQTHHLNQLQLALTHDSRSVSSLDEELRTMKAKISKTKSRLMSLDGQEDNLLRLFGDYTVVLNKAIKQAYEKRMFSQMPIGPIGSFIKVKDRSWAPAVESIIGGELLRSYYVNSHEDRKVLYELMKKIMKSAKSYPSVTASKFTHVVYDYRGNAVQSPGHSSVLDMLEVKEPLVINYLMDLVGIESILLVENPKEAREMMKDARRVPKNCRRVVMKNGDTLYPDPNYRIYSGDDRKEAKFLQVSVDEAKRRLMAEIADCNKWAANTVTQKAEVAKQIEKHMAEIAQVQETLSRMSSKKLAISSTLKELQQTVIDASDNLQFWVEERDSLKPSLETAGEELAVLRSNLNNLKSAYKNLMEDYNKQKDAFRRKTGSIDALVSETNQYDSKISQINSALKNLSRKRVEYTRNLAELIKQVDAQKEDLKNKILSVEKSQGNPQEIGEKYTAAKEKCDMLEEKILALDECIKKLKVMLKHRREVYSNCLTSLVTRVKLVFQTLITRRRFQGFIVVDHKAKTLDIKIALRDPPPKSGNAALKTGMKRSGGPDSDPKSLSGGERSFSTVAYIIALWEAVELPFYALDEFDVFMDNINREWTLGLLTDHAKEKKECQFVFLTPQSLGSLAEDDDVTIFSLKPHEAQRKAVY
ncbi:hypothetical protein J437_LFUL000069 [Ladona fulva]|uniref:RecF/RecN/SMC N-terminal domain-containing protein n=1 Tax=Ladona fulva TaxID=123851 RepID=A0A8K0K0G4_LADFU|nr:hypothetical protein J437_LFUL000069 [Ladona fulva]